MPVDDNKHLDPALLPKLLRKASLRQLQIFESVAREGGYTRAANALFLTQPTVSMQIQKLEEAVGSPLFEKIGRKIHLTAAGDILLQHVGEVIAALQRAEEALARLKNLELGSLRIAAVSTSEYFIPRLLGAFCQDHPAIDVALEVGNRERLLARMRENLDDLYVFGRPPEDLAAEFYPFLPNPLVIFARDDHPLAGEKRIPLERIAEEAFLLREAGSGTRNSIEKCFRERHLPLRVRMELGSNEAIKQAVIGGFGVAALSRNTLESGCERLKILDVEGFPIISSWHIGHPTGKQPSMAAKRFLEFLTQQSQSQPQDTQPSVEAH